MLREPVGTDPDPLEHGGEGGEAGMPHLWYPAFPALGCTRQTGGFNVQCWIGPDDPRTWCGAEPVVSLTVNVQGVPTTLRWCREHVPPRMTVSYSDYDDDLSIPHSHPATEREPHLQDRDRVPEGRGDL